MEDDTIYFPSNEFERTLKRTQGIRAFREYRRQLYEDQKKERRIWDTLRFSGLVGFANGKFLRGKLK